MKLDPDEPIEIMKKLEQEHPTKSRFLCAPMTGSQATSDDKVLPREYNFQGQYPGQIGEFLKELWSLLRSRQDEISVNSTGTGSAAGTLAYTHISRYDRVSMNEVRDIVKKLQPGDDRSETQQRGGNTTINIVGQGSAGGNAITLLLNKMQKESESDQEQSFSIDNLHEMVGEMIDKNEVSSADHSDAKNLAKGLKQISNDSNSSTRNIERMSQQLNNLQTVVMQTVVPVMQTVVPKLVSIESKLDTHTKIMETSHSQASSSKPADFSTKDALPAGKPKIPLLENSSQDSIHNTVAVEVEDSAEFSSGLELEQTKKEDVDPNCTPGPGEHVLPCEPLTEQSSLTNISDRKRRKLNKNRKEPTKKKKPDDLHGAVAAAPLALATARSEDSSDPTIQKFVNAATLLKEIPVQKTVTSTVDGIGSASTRAAIVVADEDDRSDHELDKEQKDELKNL